MLSLEITYRGIMVRFPDGSGVAFVKNALSQFVEGQYCIWGDKTSDEVRDMRMAARRFVLERGHAIIL